MPIRTSGFCAGPSLTARSRRSSAGPCDGVSSGNVTATPRTRGKVVEQDFRIHAKDHEQQRTEDDTQRQAEPKSMSDDWPHALTRWLRENQRCAATTGAVSPALATSRSAWVKP